MKIQKNSNIQKNSKISDRRKSEKVDLKIDFQTLKLRDRPHRPAMVSESDSNTNRYNQMVSPNFVTFSGRSHGDHLTFGSDQILISSLRTALLISLPVTLMSSSQTLNEKLSGIQRPKSRKDYSANLAIDLNRLEKKIFFFKKRQKLKVCVFKLKVQLKNIETFKI